jgi:hypothetical protein
MGSPLSSCIAHLGEGPGLSHAAHVGERLLDAQGASGAFHQVDKVDVAVAHLTHCKCQTSSKGVNM